MPCLYTRTQVLIVVGSTRSLQFVGLAQLIIINILLSYYNISIKDQYNYFVCILSLI